MSSTRTTLGPVDRPQAGPRVVVAEDELVALAVQGVAVGAVGGEPDPVAEAVPVDDPVDLRASARRRRPERADERRGKRERAVMRRRRVGRGGRATRACITSTARARRSRGAGRLGAASASSDWPSGTGHIGYPNYSWGIASIVAAEMDFRRPLSVVAPTLDGDVLGVLAGAEEEFTGRRIHQVLGHGSEAGVRKAADRLVEQGIVDSPAGGPGQALQPEPRSPRGALRRRAWRSLRPKLIERLEARRKLGDLPPACHGLVRLGRAWGGRAEERPRPLRRCVLRVDALQRTRLAGAARRRSRAKPPSWTGNEARVVEYPQSRNLPDPDGPQDRPRSHCEDGVPISGTREPASTLPLRKVKRRA